MVNGEREARFAVEMAKVIAGGAEELRRRPVMSDLIGTISPLVVDKDGIEAALVFAEAGVPVCFVTMPTLGTTAPATKAGAFALGAAELVAATVLLQLVAPGAPVLHSIMQSYADPRSGGFVSFPQDSRCRFLATELAHHWGVPSEAACCGTDSPAAGTWQAGVEDGMDLVQAAWEGIDLMPCIGLVNVYTLFIPEDIVLGDDIYHRARYALLDLDLDDEAMALAAIADVGPGGHFLGHRHTRRHMREALRAGDHAPAGSGRSLPRPRRGGTREGRAHLARVPAGAARGRRRPPSSRGSSRRRTRSCAADGAGTGLGVGCRPMGPDDTTSTRDSLKAVMAELAGMASEEDRAGMARYGIKTDDAFGVSVYELRRVAKGHRRDHDLALALWGTGNHEARLLASMVDDPALVTEAQMDAWAADFDSWDVCDQVTSNLFDKTPFAYDKVAEWSAARTSG